MRYLVLATDYDGTLAEHGRVSERTFEALRRVRASGRRLVLVTGRTLDDLREVFPKYAIFDRIVAENGAVVFSPESGEESMLGEPAPAALVSALRERNVEPLSVGKVIVATWEPHQNTVLEAIHELALEHRVIFNKGAVMVLPTGINKASGLRAALAGMRLCAHNTVAIGDAENDHALLAECETAVAVQNALPKIKERVDWVTEGARGEGVVELIERLLASDLAELEPRLARHDLLLGETHDGSPVRVHPHGRRILFCGTSGSGKSRLAYGFLERLFEKRYSFCVLDPEGDFPGLPGALRIGGESEAPDPKDVLDVLSQDRSVVVNLLGVRLDRRPLFLVPFLARLAEHRSRYGCPHWIVIDEAHHMLPQGDVRVPEPLSNLPRGLLLITVHSDRLARSVLKEIDAVVVVGQSPHEAIDRYAAAVGMPDPPLADDAPLGPGEALWWSKARPSETVRFRTMLPKAEHHRHQRKYAAGELGHDKSFYFRGPNGALNLRAHNLTLFLQMADGVDDATWLHHLHQNDYSRWLRKDIKNEKLAAIVEEIERDESLGPKTTRERIRTAIEREYTLPA